MTGIIVARMQVPYLHIGHLHLISTALRECDKVVIILGYQTVIDSRNPYSLMYRTIMIRKIFPQITVMTISDKESDKEWSEELDRTALMFDDPVLYHSRDSFKEHYTGKLPLKEVEEIPGFSGTKLRQQYE
jgi:nicotinamide mononucleotide adenylyltransferase